MQLQSNSYQISFQSYKQVLRQIGVQFKNNNMVAKRTMTVIWALKNDILIIDFKLGIIPERNPPRVTEHFVLYCTGNPKLIMRF